MPFYRFNGLMVHMRGRKLPKPCAGHVIVKKPEGSTTEYCMAMSGYLCDWPKEGGGTCDTPLCDAHAHEVGKNAHYCPPHFQAHLDQLAQQSLFTFPTDV